MKTDHRRVLEHDRRGVFEVRTTSICDVKVVRSLKLLMVNLNIVYCPKWIVLLYSLFDCARERGLLFEAVYRGALGARSSGSRGPSCTTCL